MQQTPVNLSTYGLMDVNPGSDGLKWCFPALPSGAPPKARLSLQSVSGALTTAHGAGVGGEASGTARLCGALLLCLSPLCLRTRGHSTRNGNAQRRATSPIKSRL